MKRDSRVNVKSMTFLNYLALFGAMLLFCGSYAGIYFLQQQEPDNTTYTILSMFTFVVVISGVVCVLFELFRQKYLMRPVNRLCDAAQRVAKGDFSVRLAPMRTDGKKDEFEVLFEDFNTMTAELASTEMLKNDFISNVSHELKTPLAVIQNYATILQSDGLTEAERREYSQRIGEAAGRLSALVSNILQLNRLENQKIHPSTAPFNLSEALSRCILNYDALLEEKSIDLQADLDQDLILTGDEALLDMVWHNLLSNAVKFTPAGGCISIRMACDGGFAAVTIADSGIGMDAETVRHIFDKFYQADTSHATQGNGLGLALVQRIREIEQGEEDDAKRQEEKPTCHGGCGRPAHGPGRSSPRGGRGGPPESAANGGQLLYP